MAPTSKPVVSVRMWRLRPFTFLPASNPRGPPASVVLTDSLSITPAGGLASRPALFASLHHQHVVNLLQQAAVAPRIEISLHRRIGRKILWQHPPLTTALSHEEQRVHHPSQFRRARPTAPLRTHRQQRLNQRAFLD